MNDRQNTSGGGPVSRALPPALEWEDFLDEGDLGFVLSDGKVAVLYGRTVRSFLQSRKNVLYEPVREPFSQGKCEVSHPRHFLNRENNSSL